MLEFSPNASWVHNSLGMVLYKQSRWPEAEAALRRAMEFEAGRGRLSESWARCSTNVAGPSKQSRFFRRAFARQPVGRRTAVQLGQRAAGYGAAGRGQCHCSTRRCGPTRTVPMLDSIASLVRLLQRDFATGWSEYEWRWKRTNAPIYGPFSQPILGWPASSRAARCCSSASKVLATRCSSSAWPRSSPARRARGVLCPAFDCGLDSQLPGDRRSGGRR